MLDALLVADAGTLVIGADTGPGSGAAAAVVADGDGLALATVGAVLRSLPVQARGSDGEVHDYDDPAWCARRCVRRSPRRGSAERPSPPLGFRPRTPPRSAKATLPGYPPWRARR